MPDGVVSCGRMRALVTGCAGFIGSHLSESLLEDGHEVVGIDCFNDNYGRRQKLRNIDHARSWDGFDFVPIDLARGDLDDVVADRDVIFHLAAEPGVRSSWGGRFESYVRNNVLATQHLLEAATAEPERRFVYASSSSVYGQAERFPTSERDIPAPVSPYGATKLTGEHLVNLYAANHGLGAISLRYFSVYGPRQRPDMAFSIFAAALMDARAFEVFGGEQTRDFTFVGDVVQATRAAGSAATPPGTVVNVGGGSRVSLLDAVGVLEAVSSRTAEIVRTGSQPGDVRDTSADIAQARLLLDYQPTTTLESGLAAQWEWLSRESVRPHAHTP
jgi:UDP-glucuronate 4-epimerase